MGTVAEVGDQAPLVGSDGMPCAGSPGVATIGRIADEVDRVHAARVLRARVGADHRARAASSTDVPGRRAAIQRSISSSASTTPALAEHSVAMLASVARSSGDSDAQARPAELHHAVERLLASCAWLARM